MKVKLKIDSAAIKDFFKEQGEKFIFGFGVLILLLFIYSIFKRETLPPNLQPQAVSSDAANAVATVDKAPFDGSDIKPSEVPNAIAPLPVEQLADIRPYIMPDGPFEDPHKRTDPNLFPVLAVQAYSGRGAIALGGNGPGNGGRGIGGPVAPAVPVPRGGVPQRDPSAPQVPPRRGGARAAVSPNKAPPGVGLPPRGAAPDAPDANGNQPLPAGFVLVGAQGNGNAEARVYNIVTGALPVGQQLKEFDIRFAHARRAAAEAAAGPGVPPRGGSAVDQRDVPQYVWWRLERTDLTNGNEKTVIDYGDVPQILADREDPSIGKDLVTKSLKPGRAFGKLTADIKTWQGTGAEVVPTDYLNDYWLSWPLPPILMHDWGHEATNPMIPLVSPQAAAAEPAAPAVDPAAKPAEADPFARDNGAAAGPAAGPRGTRLRIPAPGFDPSAPRGAMRGMPGNPGAAAAPEIPYKLYRFVDFNVEPGHTYQYRVQLVVKNPNFGLAPEVLFKPDPKPEPYRETPWSEMSPPTTVPLDTQLMTEGVDRPHRAEPKGLVGVLLWDKKDAVELLAQETLELGAIANFIQKKLQGVVDPVNHNMHDFVADFQTDSALIDLRGGVEKPAGDKASADKADNGDPGELLFLVMGKDGKPDQLVVVNRARDKSAIEDWEKAHKPVTETTDAGDAGGGLLGVPPPTTPKKEAAAPNGLGIPPAKAPPRTTEPGRGRR